MRFSTSRWLPPFRAARCILALVSLATLCGTQAASAASIYFAEFRAASKGSPYAFTVDKTNTTATFAATTPVIFNFSNVNGAPSQAYNATLTLSSTTTAADVETKVPHTSITTEGQPINNHSTIAITYFDPVAHKTENLLTAIFTGTLGGLKGSTSGGLTASQTGGNFVSFSSDFLNFSKASKENLSLAFTAILDSIKNDKGLMKGPKFLVPFTAAGTGTFGAQGVTAVPEPATLAMFGVGLLGVPMLRLVRRKTSTAVSA